jgi:chromosome segregation ATPase
VSADRTTEILNYLSAISREVGEMRQEMNARLSRLESDVRGIHTRLDRLEARILDGRADQRELEDRVSALESGSR